MKDINLENCPADEKGRDNLLVELTTLINKIQGGERIKSWSLLRLRVVLIETEWIEKDGVNRQFEHMFKTTELLEKLAAQ